MTMEQLYESFDDNAAGIVHKPSGRQPHIDFLGNDKVECYEGCNPMIQEKECVQTRRLHHLEGIYGHQAIVHKPPGRQPHIDS